MFNFPEKKPLPENIIEVLKKQIIGESKIVETIPLSEKVEANSQAIEDIMTVLMEES